jgi:hypothetical protein
VTDFLDEKRKEITKRLEELAPLVNEHRRLVAAVAAMRGIPLAPSRASATAAVRPAASTPAATPPARPAVAAPALIPATAEPKKPPRPKASGKKVSSPEGKVAGPKGRGGRPKGSGKRAGQALSFVQEAPGITVGELAVKMGIKQNYLYRLLPSLEKDGKLEKKGRGWYPTGA